MMLAEATCRLVRLVDKIAVRWPFEKKNGFFAPSPKNMVQSMTQWLHRTLAAAPPRRVSLWMAAVLATLGMANSLTVIHAAESRPNVLVILTDDQGWGDLSLHGNHNLRTPNIDSLARDGVSFENFYVCAVCAPTRAEFLTGRYHPRTGVTGVSRGEERLNPDEQTIADLFREAGYATGAFGKWHNGTQSPLHPNDQGFDEFYGFTSGHWGHYFSPPLDHNGNRVRGRGYLPNDCTDHALQFIREQSDKPTPFFCYLPLNTPHSPMMVEDRFYNKFADFQPRMTHRDPQREDLAMTRAALAMCENIDWNVGRLLALLDERDLADNTIVLFFCDNGPNSFRWNGGMKGRKGSIDEGGLRSPLLIRWPARLQGGGKVRQVAGAIDLLPTLASLCGLEAKTRQPLDGANLSPLLRREPVSKTWEQRQLFAFRKNAVSVRMGPFRLDGAGRLYNIETDRGQRHDVAALRPELAKQLRSAAAEHLAEMQRAIRRTGERPFHVGFGRVSTLPARDGVPHGKIQRSSKAPNNSFFQNWVDSQDTMTWDIQVAEAGKYEITVYYTCAEGNEGVTVEAFAGAAGAAAAAVVADAFAPPLYDKSKERVANSHYFVKDFKPLVLGTLPLSAGRQSIQLRARGQQGPGIIDVHSLDLDRKPGE